MKTYTTGTGKRVVLTEKQAKRYEEAKSRFGGLEIFGEDVEGMICIEYPRESWHWYITKEGRILDRYFNPTTLQRAFGRK